MFRYIGTDYLYGRYIAMQRSKRLNILSLCLVYVKIIYLLITLDNTCVNIGAYTVH